MASPSRINARARASRIADTISGAFIRNVEARIAELEVGTDPEQAREMRDVLRLGRLLLAGQEVTL